MVTFSLPGDDAAELNHSTPRARAPLPFSKRASSVSSPYNTAPKRLGTPGSASRKTLWTRDDVPTSSLNRSFSGASNLFATSTISDSPPASRSFSPSLSHTPAHKVFAPGATPEPSRVQRERTAQPTPRGIAHKTMEKDLFTMRIEEPPKELSGDALIKKIPDGWDPRGSIYADQFLQDSCPAEYDDEQRRQWFCVLDLRRLKYSANELFARKGWKLNIMNFAKEYEKSRSIILLHYGLYEFRNVKPSKELVKKWRREHGLPPLEDDEPSATPVKSASKKKRKASEDTFDEDEVANKNKRRATDKDDVQQTSATLPDALPAPPAAATPSFGKNKRKASDDENAESQPSKKPSSARTLFENAAKKASTTPSSAPPKSSGNIFGSKPTNSLMQSVLKNNAKTDAAQQPAAGSNIFGHLSDSSAKNSGQEADGESSTDSESEGSPEEVSDEPPAKKAAPDTAETSSNAGTRESTPGRSLFDRVSKGANGEPVRAETPAGAAPPKDQTWNPSTTPIKFAPAGNATATSSTGLFGNAGNSSASSIFAPKSTATSSNLFGAPKEDKPVEKRTETTDTAEKGDGESDKENDSTGPNQQKALPEPKQHQPDSGASLFQSKSSETPKESEATKAAPANLFGGPKPSESSNLFGAQKPAETPNLFGAAKPAESSSEKPNLFGGASKPAADAAPGATYVMNSSTLFGQKPDEPKKPVFDPQKPLFGAAAPVEKKTDTPSGSLFGAKPAETSSNIFGNGTASASAPKPLFGAAAATDSTTQAASPAAPAFSFGKPAGSQTNGASQPSSNLFGAPKSPPAAKGTTGLFDGSPMKQDDKSPAKPAFGAPTGGAPSFSFGQSTSTTPAFGTNSAQASGASNTGGNIFGASSSTPAAGGSGGFNFQFGGSSGGGSTFNNPFASGDQASSQGTTSTGFNFGGATGASNAAPSSGSTFQFGAKSGNSTPSGGIFSAGQANANGTLAFGAGPPGQSSGNTGFTFGAGQSQPLQPSQGNNGPAFLAPPAPSSTGTNTPSMFGGGSSLATTPARGTPEPSNQAESAKGGEDDEGEKHEQIDLSGGAEEGEETLHEVRAKALRFVAPDKSEGDGDKSKSKSPWKTEGLGQLRLLKNKETNAVRLLLRAEPRGNVAMNRMVLPDLEYKAEKKYLKVTTSNDKGDGLETWMIQVKTEELSKALAKALEENKGANKK